MFSSMNICGLNLAMQSNLHASIVLCLIKSLLDLIHDITTYKGETSTHFPWALLMPYAQLSYNNGHDAYNENEFCKVSYSVAFQLWKGHVCFSTSKKRNFGNVHFIEWMKKPWCLKKNKFFQLWKDHICFSTFKKWILLV